MLSDAGWPQRGRVSLDPLALLGESGRALRGGRHAADRYAAVALRALVLADPASELPSVLTNSQLGRRLNLGSQLQVSKQEEGFWRA